MKILKVKIRVLAAWNNYIGASGTREPVLKQLVVFYRKIISIRFYRWSAAGLPKNQSLIKWLCGKPLVDKHAFWGAIADVLSKYYFRKVHSQNSRTFAFRITFFTPGVQHGGEMSVLERGRLVVVAVAAVHDVLFYCSLSASFLS